jgi:hypothetical protein
MIKHATIVSVFESIPESSYGLNFIPAIHRKLVHDAAHRKAVIDIPDNTLTVTSVVV